ncbi:Fungal lignin peroxidase [Macrophomina phaseolina MS6]|uniref:Peroxidase n=2 Tax=Macrophomina phaseolina TaxID=35725 RepID=K2SCI0_MACPH|nr:Fungal lignin peroxidase [Macrophomina phaseolina MS6]KAH7045855.1 heme peroxidase [Macrophomina phaseolina]
MLFSKSSIFLLSTAASVQALSLSDVSSAASVLKREASGLGNNLLSLVHRRDSCPDVWQKVASELKGWFLDGSVCSDDARAAIRLSFHDCFSGGCDGSIILAHEYTRSDNAGLADFAMKLAPLADQYEVGTADLIQFAGALATATCPLGPRIAVKVGRQDSSTPSAEGQLPSSRSSASVLIDQFAAKGFSEIDLVALVGAHSTAKQFFDQPDKAGQSLDSTPGTWDTNFYRQTTLGTAPVTLESDKNLATDLRTAVQWTAFNAQGVWAAAYVSAMNKMTVLGNDVSSLTDCTSVISAATSKRDIKAAPIADRI